MKKLRAFPFNKIIFFLLIFCLDFNTTDAINYVDDLSTLRTIVDAFSFRQTKNDWGVVGTDLSAGSNEEEARLYSELSQHIVEAVGWSQYVYLL